MNQGVLIYNARLLDESIDSPGAILIVNKKIRAVFQGYFTDSKTVQQFAVSILAEDGLDEMPLDFYDARGLTITPAFIDMHVHTRYPGQTHKEDLSSALRAAAAGGFGTVVAMPNTNPVVSSMELAKQIEKEAASIGLTHLFQSVSITKDFDGKTTNHLADVEREYVPLITEDGKDVLSSAAMLSAMMTASIKGLIVGCHCEDPTLAEYARGFRRDALDVMQKYGISYSDSEISGVSEEEAQKISGDIDISLTLANEILALAEDLATERNIMLAKNAECHIHLAHVSTANSINAIRAAKNEILDEMADLQATNADNSYFDFFEKAKASSGEQGKSNFVVTCEVTPHHLALCGTESPFIRYLVNPPLRCEDDRIALLEALRDGTVDVISTDHAPHTISEKLDGAPGFTGLETAFGICNTVLVLQNQFSPKRLSQLMSANPARILGLKKGLLSVGYDADLTLFDSEEEWNVEPEEFYSKGKVTPFEDITLTGKVKGLFIDGRLVFEK